MSAEDEIKFIFNQYIKKSDKIKNSIEQINKSNMSEDLKNRKINNLNKKLRKLQDKYIRFLGVNPKRKE